MNEIELGSAERFADFPAEVRIGRDAYYLVKGGEGFRLLSRTCPHAGYEVEEEYGGFYCYMHGWSFDGRTGKCLNVTGAELTSYEVELRDGVFYAKNLPAAEAGR